ncbi:hypothetical protein ACF0H5_020575 [Mactra antiquata]
MDSVPVPEEFDNVPGLENGVNHIEINDVKTGADNSANKITRPTVLELPPLESKNSRPYVVLSPHGTI